jgi:kumamolisin
MQIAAQGQSFFAAAGDSGAFDNGSTLSVDDPGSQPYMTSVGGTTLTLNSDGSYGKETSWAVQGGSVKEGGGGGISAVWPIPTWQQNLGTAANQGSTTMRMVPDVALDADPNSGYAIFSQGAWQEVGGTSCAAPLWAAFTALVNQQRAINGQGGLGFPNLSLYSDAESSAYTVNFHDIADGSANLHFTAVKGYDLSTGWGTMIGSSLLASLGSTRLTPAVTSKLAEQSKSNR